MESIKLSVQTDHRLFDVRVKILSPRHQCENPYWTRDPRSSEGLLSDINSLISAGGPVVKLEPQDLPCSLEAQLAFLKVGPWINCRSRSGFDAECFSNASRRPTLDPLEDPTVDPLEDPTLAPLEDPNSGDQTHRPWTHWRTQPWTYWRTQPWTYWRTQPWSHWRTQPWTYWRTQTQETRPTDPGPIGGPNPGPTGGPNPGPTGGPNPGPIGGPNPGPTEGPNPGPSGGPKLGPWVYWRTQTSRPWVRSTVLHFAVVTRRGASSARRYEYGDGGRGDPSRTHRGPVTQTRGPGGTEGRGDQARDAANGIAGIASVRQDVPGG